MTHKTYADQLREDRRLVLLRLLSDAPGKSMNSSNLDRGLRHLHMIGTRADTLDDLRWLHDQALLRLEPLADIAGLYAATLTAHGLDVARGEMSVPGVAEPSLR